MTSFVFISGWFVAARGRMARQRNRNKTTKLLYQQTTPQKKKMNTHKSRRPPFWLDSSFSVCVCVYVDMVYYTRPIVTECGSDLRTRNSYATSGHGTSSLGQAYSRDDETFDKVYVDPIRPWLLYIHRVLLCTVTLQRR